MRSRYYNPEWGRFISADSVADTRMMFIDSNLFAYCMNDPVCLVDVDGRLGFIGILISTDVATITPYDTIGLLGSIGRYLNVPIDIVLTDISTIPESGIIVPDIPQVSESDIPVVEFNPVAPRIRFNTKKKAKEAAQRAGKGKKPRLDRETKKNSEKKKSAHYHPNVERKYKQTPHEVTEHDHYYFPNSRFSATIGIPKKMTRVVQ